MGPGDIAALPPTIGLSNKPTISANDPGRRITGSLGCCGNDENGNGAIGSGLLLPIGIGVVLGGALYFMTSR
jgi:hypothetical protein